MLSLHSGFLYKHASFLVLLLGGGGLYVSNIMLASMLTPVDYGQYGLMMAYIAFVGAFSGIGFDQLITRYAKIIERKVFIPFELKKITCFLILISSLLFAFLYSVFFSGSFFWLFLLSLMSGATLYYYTIFRLSSHFVAAQIQKNLWKVLFPIVILFIVVWRGAIDLRILIGVLIVLLIITIIQGAILYRKVDKEVLIDGNVDFSLLFGYAISMLIMNYMTLGDRFLAQKILGDSEVARLFFVQNLFLFPLTQLQTYFGFKDIVQFKKKFSLTLLHKMLIRNCVVSVFASISILLLFLILSKFVNLDSYLNISKDWMLILLLIIMGVIRIVYSSLSTAMSVSADRKDINNSNLSMIYFLFLGSLLLFLLRDFFVNLEIIFLVFLGFWTFRVMTYYTLLKRKLYEI